MLCKECDKMYQQSDVFVGTCSLCRQLIPTDASSSLAFLEGHIEGTSENKGWALELIGQYYLEGKGVKQSYDTALSFYQQAADLGKVSAIYNVGIFYQNGWGVPHSWNDAFFYYQRAAACGFVTAYRNMIFCYYNGLGVGPCQDQAVSWMVKLADSGDTEYEFKVGTMLVEGQFLPKSIERGLPYLIRAAEKGDPHAAIALYEMYSEGTGTHGLDRDDELAIKYYTIAVAAEDEGATDGVNDAKAGGEGLI